MSFIWSRSLGLIYHAGRYVVDKVDSYVISAPPHILTMSRFFAALSSQNWKMFYSASFFIDQFLATLRSLFKRTLCPLPATCKQQIWSFATMSFS
jgi:hypothetical protein